MRKNEKRLQSIDSSDYINHVTEELLLKLLSSSRFQTKPATLAYAAKTVGIRLSSERAIPALLPLLKHTSPIVREGAIHGLGPHITYLTEGQLWQVHLLATSDDSVYVKSAACVVLGYQRKKITMPNFGFFSWLFFWLFSAIILHLFLSLFGFTLLSGNWPFYIGLLIAGSWSVVLWWERRQGAKLRGVAARQEPPGVDRNGGPVSV